MTKRKVVDAEILLSKRQLRAEIAGTRLRTSSTLVALVDQRRRFTSWRTYVRQFPLAALGVSFGVGLWIAAARPGRRLPRTLAAGLVQWGITAVRSGLLNEVRSVWEGSRSPDRDAGAS